MKFNQLVCATDVHVGGETFRFINESEAFNANNFTNKQKEFKGIAPLQLKRLLEEPRGHSGMRICILMQPTMDGTDFKLAFLDSVGCSQFVEHGLLAAATLLAELYHIQKNLFRFEHNGCIYNVSVVYNSNGETIKDAAFTESVGYKIADIPFETSSVDVIRAGQYDVAVTDVVPFNLTLTNHDLHALKKFAFRWFAKSKQIVKSPEAVNRLIFYQKNSNGTYRFITFDQNSRIDRSPYLGAWAFSAFLYHKGRIKEKTPFELCNFLNHNVHAEVIKIPTKSRVDQLDITVKGKGYIIALHQFVIDSDDPLKDGFLLK